MTRPQETSSNEMSVSQTQQMMEIIELEAMRQSFAAQLGDPSFIELSFETRVGMLVKDQFDSWLMKRTDKLLKESGLDLRDNPSIHALNYSKARGLRPNVVNFAVQGHWVDSEHPASLLITGPTGSGKTYLATAIAKELIQQGKNVRYRKLRTLLQEIDKANEKKTFARFSRAFAKHDLVVIDDFGMTPINDAQSAALMELIEIRIGYGATIITSQLEIGLWHDYIGNVLLADAIMDRLVNLSYEIKLRGDSNRKGKLKPLSSSAGTDVAEESAG